MKALRHINNFNSQQNRCQYTIDELRVRLKKGRISAKEGVYKTQSEIRHKHI